MTRQEKQVPDRPQSSIRKAVKEHGMIILYVLQLLLILMYMEAEIQPFVYVRF